jgi:hypothetical protein
VAFILVFFSCIVIIVGFAVHLGIFGYKIFFLACLIKFNMGITHEQLSFLVHVLAYALNLTIIIAIKLIFELHIAY